jgi:hypothetical protein
VSLSEAFAEGDSIQQMAACGKLHPVMPGLIGFPTMYLHQQQVFEAVQAGCHVLVSTGTGSGKTEAFLHPIVDDLLRERDGIVVGGPLVVGGMASETAMVLKQLFPHFIRDYLLDSENQFRNAPLDTSPLQTLMTELPELPGELVALFANNRISRASSGGMRRPIRSAFWASRDSCPDTGSTTAA